MKKKNLTKRYYLLKSKRDPFYNSLWLNKFSNHFVKSGKKFIVEKIFFRSFAQFKQMKKWRHLPKGECLDIVHVSNNNLVSRKILRSCSFLHLLLSRIKPEAKDLRKILVVALVELERHIYPVQSISFLFSLLVYLFALRTYSTEDETYAIQHYHKAAAVIKVIATRPLHILLRHFVKTKPLFQLISKRFGSTIINIPMPLSSNRQLLTAVRLCARDIKVFRFANNLEHQIYMYLISCMSSGRTSWDRERDKKVKAIVASRTNIRFRWR